MTTTPPTTCTPATSPQVAQVAADAIQRAGSAMPKDSIEWIIVYSANTHGYPMPATNTTSFTCSSKCVKYVWDDGPEQVQVLQRVVELRLDQRLPQRPQP